MRQFGASGTDGLNSNRIFCSSCRIVLSFNSRKTSKIDLKASRVADYKDLQCMSNPELNKYIKKPKFSRDVYDLDVQRWPFYFFTFFLIFTFVTQSRIVNFMSATPNIFQSAQQTP